MELSRRFFLAGAISLIAAKTFIPANAGNLPTIYGNGLNDDTSGLGALFRNEPCLFNKEMIAVENHEGIEFYFGRFVVFQTINIPRDTKLDFNISKHTHFIGTRLEDNFPFFICEDFSGHIFEKGIAVTFEVNRSHKAPLVHFPFLNETFG